MEIGILGELLKSFISDFGLEGRKILHKVDTVDHSSYGQLMTKKSMNAIQLYRAGRFQPIAYNVLFVGLQPHRSF